MFQMTSNTALAEDGRDFADLEVERVVRCHNRRLFRIARSILRNDADSEDVVQDTYVQAFSRMETFRGDGPLEGWLSRIAVNLAYARLRKARRRDTSGLSIVASDHNTLAQIADRSVIPADRRVASTQARHLIEIEIDSLPDGIREVFVLRAVEEMSIAETADLLAIPAATVKSRFHRARAAIRRGLENHVDRHAPEAFPFGGVRCDAMLRRVVERLVRGTTDAPPQA